MSMPLDQKLKPELSLDRMISKQSTVQNVGAGINFKKPIIDTGRPLLDRVGTNDKVNLYKGADINTELRSISEHYRSQAFKSL